MQAPAPYLPQLASTAANDLELSEKQKETPYVLTYRRRYATNPPGSVEDIVCTLDGEPLAFMVLVNGQFQSHIVHYDGAIHRIRTVTSEEEMARKEWLRAHEAEIRDGCMELVSIQDIFKGGRHYC